MDPSWSNYSMIMTIMSTVMPAEMSDLNCSVNSSDVCPEDKYVPYVPYGERPETYIVPVVFACILVVGVMGNGVLMITICRHANMRNVPNTYVLSLAIGDLLVSQRFFLLFTFLTFDLHRCTGHVPMIMMM